MMEIEINGQQRKSSCTGYNCGICRDKGIILYDKDGYTYTRECSCGMLKKERVDSKLKFADLPEAFKDMKLSNFRSDVYDLEESRKVIDINLKAVKYWLENIEEMKKKGMGLYFYSQTKGSGKTRLASSIANELIIKQNITVKFTTTVQLIDEIKATWDASYDITEHQLLKDLSKTEVLIIDDFGVEEAKNWIMERFYQIINNRYISNLITIFTSNMNINMIGYGDRITNRIKERCYTLAFPEESVRDKIYKRNMAELAAAIG